MKTKLLVPEVNYDGSQLKSLWNYLDHGLLGNSTVAFIGACDVSFAHMADGEDLRESAEIRGAKMLHFIVEIFHQSLLSGVALQRLFAALVQEELTAVLIQSKTANAPRFHRAGDDIFDGDRKFSISIATVSPMSVLIHFAVNIVNEGTPVKTCALSDWSIDPRSFAERVLKRWQTEFASIEQATMKVRWVK
jgi:hypothetical protein